MTIFNLFDDETFVHMGENNPSSLKTLFDFILETKTAESKRIVFPYLRTYNKLLIMLFLILISVDYTKVYEHLDKLLAEDVLSLEVRDSLLPFRNVEDHKVYNRSRSPPPPKVLPIANLFS